MTEQTQLSVGIKPAEAISFAHLFSAIPMEKVKEALSATGANDKRERDLPARFMVYFVIAMGLYSDSSSIDVFRNLVETLKLAFGPLFKFNIPAKSSLTYARQKLGSNSFQHLFQTVVRPIARPETIGAFFKQWRLVSIDANVFNTADTPENESRFGRATLKNAPVPYPAIRCVGLVELGTRVLFDYELGATAGANIQSEAALAEKLLPRLKSDQLCIADRLYGYYRFWELASATGAALLFRIRSSAILDCERVLEDGSYISSLFDGDRTRTTKRLEVRVIEYRIGDETYRLITNIPVSQASNTELAHLYQERWEHEITNKEQKCGLNKYIDTLRSKTPELVIQELIGLFLMHYAVRVVMHDAALLINEDVDRLSFKHTLEVIRRRAPQVGAFPPSRSVRQHSARSARAKNLSPDRAHGS